MTTEKLERITRLLSDGQVALFNEDGMFYRYGSIFTACKMAVECGRSPRNGWNIIDELGVTYEFEDWNALASIAYL